MYIVSFCTDVILFCGMEVCYKMKLTNYSLSVSNWPSSGIIVKSADQNKGQNSGVAKQKNCDKQQKFSTLWWRFNKPNHQYSPKYELHNIGNKYQNRHKKWYTWNCYKPIMTYTAAPRSNTFKSWSYWNQERWVY